MDQLRIPTRSIEAEVLMADGARVNGTLYHRDAMYDAGGPADVCQDLNDERAFLPFGANDGNGSPTLLSKQHITRVLVPAFQVEQLDAVQTEQLEQAERSVLILDDGTQVDGRLVMETPLASSRLIDKFNQAPIFVTFVTDRGVELINRARVTRILKQD